MKKLLALVLMACMTLTACNTSWVNEALAILKVALPAALNVLQLVAVLNSSPIDSAKAQTITDDVAAAEKFLEDYKTASDSAKAGVLGQLDAALLTTQADLSTILKSVHVVNPESQAKVTALADFVIAEVSAVEGLLPMSTTTVTHAKAGKPPLSAHKFKAGYNKLMPEPSLVLK